MFIALTHDGQVVPFNKTLIIVSFVFMISSHSWPAGGASPAGGTPPDPPVREESVQSLIRKAAKAADQAWEEFHRAAIGGTLASPELQVTIETQLHEVRRLLMEARKAGRAGQSGTVKALTTNIFEKTNFIVQASQKRKS